MWPLADPCDGRADNGQRARLALPAMSDARPFNVNLPSLAVVVLLLVATALILLPFLPAIAWGLVLAIATAPLHAGMLRRLPGRPRLVAVMTSLLLALILVVPAVGVTRAVIALLPTSLSWIERVAAGGLPLAPDKIRSLPLVGEQLSNHWEDLSREGSVLVAHMKDDIKTGLVWVLREMELRGGFVLEFALGIVLAGVFLATQDRSSKLARTFFDRIGGEHAVSLLDQAVATARATVRGVVGAALVQALVAAPAYAIAGMPAWLILGGLTFLLALFGFGAPLVWTNGPALTPCVAQKSQRRPNLQSTLRMPPSGRTTAAYA